jgi:Bifunctional DNA primase/polymerase, N-terminal
VQCWPGDVLRHFCPHHPDRVFDFPDERKIVANRGVTWFFRAGPEFKTKRFKLADGDGVDLLGPGAQTVIPGSYHPDTGRPYKWREDGDSLERWAPEKLPLLSADVASIIGESVKARGWVEPVVHEHARGGGNGVLGGLKAEAMTRVHEWLPALGVPVEGNRAVAVWRGGEGYNVNIYHDGFHDFGGGRSEQLSAVNVVMAVKNYTCGEAARWLKNRIGYEDPEQDPPAEIFDFSTRKRVRSAAVNEPEQTTQAPMQPALAAAAPSKFAMIWLSDIVLNLDDEWLFKRLIPKVGAVSIFGDCSFTSPSALPWIGTSPDTSARILVRSFMSQPRTRRVSRNGSSDIAWRTESRRPMFLSPSSG